jgi:hypothetical protein
MTIVRQITGSSADSVLSDIVNKMFKSNPTKDADKVIKSLGLDDEKNAPSRFLYKYEIEIEFNGIKDSSGKLLTDQSSAILRPIDITNAAELIILSADPDITKDLWIQEEVYNIAKYIISPAGYQARFKNELGLKRLLPQVLSVNKTSYKNIYPPKGYFITDKADGIRAICIIRGDKNIIITSDQLFEFQKPQKNNNEGHGTTIVDGELIQSENHKEFLIFDVIVINEENMADKPFEERFKYFQHAKSILVSSGINAQTKKFIRLASDESLVPSIMKEEIEGILKNSNNPDKKYKIDGLIFIEPGKNYVSTHSYKWKDFENNTVDFLVKRAPSSILGKEPYVDTKEYKIYLLFVGIDKNLRQSLNIQFCPGYKDIFRTFNYDSDYFPIQFSPSGSPYAYIFRHKSDEDIDNKIVEMRCASKENICIDMSGRIGITNWGIVKIREDRQRDLLTNQYFGNDFFVAEMIWLNYLDPFSVDQLWNGPSADYFINNKANTYKAQTALISFMKSEVMESISQSKTVIDIGIGKGQDLGRYFKYKIHNLIAIDKDPAALSSLVTRKYDIVKSNKRNKNIKQFSTHIQIIVADINEEYPVNIAKLESAGFILETAQAVVCNLAVHYFMSSIESIRNFITFIKMVIGVGGIVVLTFMDGKRVHNLFKSNNISEGQYWKYFEGESNKYSIKRMYGGDKKEIEPSGQKISVLLPFSNGIHYEEYLVNTDTLRKEFESKDFRQISLSYADSFLREFKSRNKLMADSLSEGDKEYISLYGEMRFKRFV